MRLHELTTFKEERKSPKRIGRGAGSGSGCTSGKGNKGQKARAGSGPKVGFEGGQMPLRRRLPKRGFKNLFRVEYQPVNLEQIESFFADKDEISIEDLYQSGLCKQNKPIKILSGGDIARAVKIEAHRFSKAAVEKIQKAGGEAVILEG